MACPGFEFPEGSKTPTSNKPSYCGRSVGLDWKPVLRVGGPVLGYDFAKPGRQLRLFLLCYVYSGNHRY